MSFRQGGILIASNLGNWTFAIGVRTYVRMEILNHGFLYG